ncbi:MAG: DUF1614 domain-containing protein [Thermoprotei archaeon]
MSSVIVHKPLASFFMYLLTILMSFIVIYLLLWSSGKVFMSLGLNPRLVSLIIFASLFGSFINIPIYKYTLDEEIILTINYVNFYGIIYPIPSFEKVKNKSVLAVNLGGAVIPVLTSLYLSYKLFTLEFDALVPLLISIIVASFVIHIYAKPIPHLGIAVPTFIPPFISMTLALFWGYLGFNKSIMLTIAYVSGTLGALIGADLANLNKIRTFKSPMVSVGGAGTFDGIFLSGLLAVLFTDLLA